MKRTVAAVLMCASAAFGADKIVVKPRVVVVVRPQSNAANLAGGIIGNAIAEWMIRRQNRAIYGKQCDALFDARCQPPAPAAAPFVPREPTAVGNTYLPGQCPGIAPCPAP